MTDIIAVIDGRTPRHTPSPWMVTSDHGPEDGWRHVSSDPDGFGDIATTWGGCKNNSEPNAHLIAAAPDMYNLLRATLKLLSTHRPITGPEALLMLMIAERLDQIDCPIQPAQGAQPAPPSSQAS